MGDNEGFEVVKRAIAEINEDEDVDGLIVYFPLFGPEKVRPTAQKYERGSDFDIEQDDELRALISPRVDVEGVHSENLSESYAAAPPSLAELSTSMSDAIIYPCTPLVVLLILESLERVYEASAPAGQRLNGEIVTVINRFVRLSTRPLQ
jgi:methylenetetrahydrofolate dehydrogenase (NAD+)